MANFYSVIVDFCTTLPLQIFLYSLAGTLFGTLCISCRGIDRLAALTLLFFVQRIIVLPPDAFVLFAVAGFTAITYQTEARQKEAVPDRIIARPVLLLLAFVAFVLAGIFIGELADLILQLRSSGMIHILFLVLLSLLISSPNPFSKALIALTSGMLVASSGNFLTSHSFSFSRAVLSSTEGFDLIIVLAGICLLAPALSGKVTRDKADSGQPRQWLRLTGLATLLLLGVGTTAATIVLFAILNYESVSFGPIIVVENISKIGAPLLSSLVSVLLLYAGKNNLCSKLQAAAAQIPEWIIQSSVVLLSAIVILTSGLGFLSLYLALFFALIGIGLEKAKIPTALFIIGIIYGSQLEYLMRIALLTKQNGLTGGASVTVFIAVSLLIGGKVYFADRRKRG